MKFICSILLFSLSLHSQVFKKFDDKAMHFYGSALGAITISEITYRITKKPLISAITGGLLMYTIGYSKERFIDYKFNKQDLFPDGFGSGTGVIGWGIHFDITDRAYIHKMKEIEKLNRNKNNF
jgi:hypothetical protein